MIDLVLSLVSGLDDAERAQLRRHLDADRPAAARRALAARREARNERVHWLIGYRGLPTATAAHWRAIYAEMSVLENVIGPCVLTGCGTSRALRSGYLRWLAEREELQDCTDTHEIPGNPAANGRHCTSVSCGRCDD